MLVELTDLVPMLRSPGTRQRLVLDGKKLRDCDGGEYALIDGVPVVFPDARAPITCLPKSHKRRETSFTKKFRSRFVISNTKEAREGNRIALQYIENNPGCNVLFVGGAAIAGGGFADIYRSPTTRVVSFDIYASPSTNLVADGHAIPLADDLFDVVFVQAVLEHVFSPQIVVAEIWRVLKPNGIVVADTPFMYPVHEGAYDFTRFSQTGHRWLFRNFEELKSGPSIGSGTMLMLHAKYFFSAVFRNKTMGKLFAAPFLLAGALDRFVPREHQMDAAGGFYFVGKKSNVSISEADVIRNYAGVQRNIGVN